MMALIYFRKYIFGQVHLQQIFLTVRSFDLAGGRFTVYLKLARFGQNAYTKL